ncbi:MAG: TonB family protein [Deltaproteobacteria bacterium]|nr:TonB family protein [Deltaproteobacteria bacterium]
MNDFLPKAIAIAILGEIGIALGLAEVAYSPNDDRPLTLVGARRSRDSKFITATVRRVVQEPPQLKPQPAPRPLPQRISAQRRKAAKLKLSPLGVSASLRQISAPGPAPAPATATASAPAFGPGGRLGVPTGATAGRATGTTCAATDSCEPAAGPATAPAPAPAPVPAPVPPAVLAEISDRIDRAARRAYPEIARRRGIEGTVRVCFHVGPPGTAPNPVVEKSSDDEDLDEAARAAVIAARPLIAPRKMRLCKAIEYQLK